MTRRNRKLCVKIARDVLTQIRLKRFEVNTGSYINVDIALKHEEYADFEKYDAIMCESFQAYFKKNKNATCEVCALGAAFVSLVNIENKCSVGEMEESDDMFDRLHQHFGGENMDLMESAFERDELRNGGSDISEEMLIAATKWGNQYDDPTKRLQVIMRNVIRNGGDFKLPKKYISMAKAMERENASRQYIPQVAKW